MLFPDYNCLSLLPLLFPTFDDKSYSTLPLNHVIALLHSYETDGSLVRQASA